MHSALACLVMLGGFGTYALPTESGQTLSVKITRNEAFEPDFERALLKAHLRYGTPIIASTSEKRALGSIDAFNPAGDSEYVADVQIGTPPQKLKLNFDTGSSDLWVFNTETPARQVNGQLLYDPTASTSVEKQNGQTWAINYADKSTASGTVVKDTVSIGGLTVPDQVVELAHQVSQAFTNDFGTSGLVGLGFDNLNTVSPNQAKTWFSNIKSSLQQQVFTSSLRHLTKGTYNFGFIDTNLYQGDITYTSVNTQSGHWDWVAKGWQVGSKGVFRQSPFPATADTGTSLLVLPGYIAKEYYASVDKAKPYYDADGKISGWTFPCKSVLPDFIYGVEGAKFVVPGSFINYAPDRRVPGNCNGGITSGGDNDPAVFGDVALKAAFVVWDVGATRLGFAQPR